MVIRRISLSFLSILFLIGGANAQVSESCDCTIDTLGLESFLSTLTLNENQQLAFEVPGASSTFAVLHGYIDGSTPSAVNTFIGSYPNVTTLVFMQMPGSDDDNANLIASQALKNQGYKHYLPSVNAYSQDAFIASGAVDMFVGGGVRVVDVGAEVGVHSWSDGSNEATDYPVGHPNHLPYINYYVSMGFSQQEAEDFYYYTINAAPANGIYNMNDTEIDQYKIRTCKYSNAPNYSITQDGNVLEADLSGAMYQWINCSDNTPISGEVNQSFNVNDNGSYAVIITENSCSDTSSCITINNVGIVESQNSQLVVYPNPSAGTLTIEGLEKIDEIQVLDINGKKYNAVILSGTMVDVNALPPGIYLLRIMNGDSVETIRFVRF